MHAFQRIALGCALLAASTSALAHRFIWVNGDRMGPAQIAQMDRLHCGMVPNGHYWFNHRSGIWGYRGDPRPRGHISDNCRRASAGGSGHVLDRGPFGTYMSDGKCSFVNGVPVGRC